MEIFYEIRKGKKKALCFIHGLGCNHTIWKHYIDHFSEKGHTVIASDLRCHGKSGCGKIDIDNLAVDVKKVLQKEKIKDVVLVGHCLGSDIAVKVSELMKIDKMVFLGFYHPDAARLKKTYIFLAYLIKLVWPLLRFTGKLLRFQDYSKLKKLPSIMYPLIDLRGTTLKTYADTLMAVYDYDIDVDSIDVDVLDIESKGDTTVKLKKVYDLARTNSRIKLVKLKGNHLTPVKKPEQHIKLIEAFI